MNGKPIGRFDKSTGVFSKIKNSRQEEDLGQVTGSGLVIINGHAYGRLNADGTIENQGPIVGKIDSRGNIEYRGKPWGTATNCCTDNSQTRYVVGYLAYFHNFVTEGVNPADDREDPVESGIEITHNGLRWGRIGDDGTVTMETGLRAGRIDSNGQVTKEGGLRLGTIARNGQITKEGGLRFGNLQANGMLISDGGLRLAMFQRDGTIVRYSNGITWGTASQCCADPVALRKVVAALVFFASDFP